MDNTRPSLSTIIELHRGNALDKWKSYVTAYEQLFQAYRDESISLLEIGVQNGGSLEIWRKYFANAKRIVGCDINPKCADLVFDDEAIRFVIGDANANDVENRILNESERFDIVIDDGSHTSSDIVRSFAKYFPHVKDGGIFVIEDLHCSYWLDFEGGLFNPTSSMSFLRMLSDIVNFEHWGTVQSRRALLNQFEKTYHTVFDEVTLAHIHSVEFQNSLCIIRKADPTANILYSRVVRGTNATVYAEAPSLHGMRNYAPPDQSASPWSAKTDHDALLIARAQEVEALRAALIEQKRQHEDALEKCHQTLAERDRLNADREQYHERRYAEALESYHLSIAERDNLGTARELDHESRLASLRLEYERRGKERDALRTQREQSLLEQLSCSHQRIKQLIEKQIERDREYVIDMLGNPFEDDGNTHR